MNGKRLILFSLIFILCGCSVLQVKKRYEDVDVNGAKMNVLNSFSIALNDKELILKSSNHKDPYIKGISRQEYFLHFSY